MSIEPALAVPVQPVLRNETEIFLPAYMSAQLPVATAGSVGANSHLPALTDHRVELTSDIISSNNASTLELSTTLTRSVTRIKDLLNQPLVLAAVAPEGRSIALPPLPKPITPSIELPDVVTPLWGVREQESAAASNLAVRKAENLFETDGAFDASSGIERTAQIPILMYHYLSTPPADADIYRLDLSVKPEQFAAHLDAMQSAGYTTISLRDLWRHLVGGVQLPPQPVILTFDDGYLDNYENAFPLLVQRSMIATFFVVTDFIDQAKPGYLTWDMAREMHAAGMSIESHGTNHFSLKNRDVEFLVFQALRSKEVIEMQIGIAPRFISYPAGEFDQNTIDVFRSANYLAGVTTIQGLSHYSSDLFELHRVRVRGTTSAVELLRLMALDW